MHYLRRSVASSPTRWFALVGILTLAVACAPAPQATPTAPPSPKPTSAPAASPVGSPAASPAAAVSAPAAPAEAPKPSIAFPTKPIEIIVPFPPGGGYDSLSRQIAIPLQRDLGQPMVIKNVPGGGQRIGARQFQQSPADGHTLGYFSDTQLFVSGFVEDPQGVDLNAWGWVAGLRYHSPAVVVVAKDTAFRSVADVIAADKVGQRLRMGHNGLGGFLSTHVVLASDLGLQNVAHIGGFNGTGDVMPSMARGDLELFVNLGVSSAYPFIQSGDIRPIAVLWPQDGRSPLLPDVPNARELGLSNLQDLEFLGASRSGFAAPPGTPTEVLQILEQATLKAAKDPAFLEWAKQSGFETELAALPGGEFREKKQREFEFWKSHEPELRRAVQ